MAKFKCQYLFLDRDGVINTRLPGKYVSSPDDFEFMPGVLKTLSKISKRTRRIIVVTNQQGVGKELMSYEDLDRVHDFMKAKIVEEGGRIDAIFSCTELADDKNNCRKPSPNMGLWAKMKFPEIDFAQALMVGDSISDIEFGKNLGMKTVLMEGKTEEEDQLKNISPDFKFKSFSKILDLVP